MGYFGDFSDLACARPEAESRIGLWFFQIFLKKKFHRCGFSTARYARWKSERRPAFGQFSDQFWSEIWPKIGRVWGFWRLVISRGCGFSTARFAGWKPRPALVLGQILRLKSQILGQNLVQNEGGSPFSWISSNFRRGFSTVAKSTISRLKIQIGLLYVFSGELWKITDFPKRRIVRLFGPFGFSKGGYRAFLGLFGLLGRFGRSLTLETQSSPSWTSVASQSAFVARVSARVHPKPLSWARFARPLLFEKSFYRSFSLIVAAQSLRAEPGLESRNKLPSTRDWGSALPGDDWVSRVRAFRYSSGPFRPVRCLRSAGFRGSRPPLARQMLRCSTILGLLAGAEESIWDFTRISTFVKSTFGPGNPKKGASRHLFWSSCGPKVAWLGLDFELKSQIAPRARLDTPENRRAAQHLATKAGQDPLKSSIEDTSWPKRAFACTLFVLDL